MNIDRKEYEKIIEELDDILKEGDQKLNIEVAESIAKWMTGKKDVTSCEINKGLVFLSLINYIQCNMEV